MADVLSNEQIIEAIKQKTLLEVNELVKMIEEEFGVSAAAPVAIAATAGAAPEAEAEEKTEFDVILKEFDPTNKIKVIKDVRALANLGLKEAKDLVEGAPKEVLTGLSKEDANAAKEKLEAVGATIEIK